MRAILEEKIKNGNKYVPSFLKKNEIDIDVVNNMVKGNLNKCIHAAQIDEYIWKPEPKTKQQHLMREFIKRKVMNVNTLKIRK